MNTETAKFIITAAAQTMALEPTRADEFITTLRTEIDQEWADVVEMAFKAGYSTAKTDVMALLATMAENGT